MATAISSLLVDRFVLAVAVIMLAAPVTYLEVVHPTLHIDGHSIGLVSGSAAPSPVSSSKPAHQTSHGSASPKTSSASSNPTLAATTMPKTALTTNYVHLRSGKSVNSAIIANLVAGTTVQLRDDADATWQGVTYRGKNGYIYRTYLQY